MYRVAELRFFHSFYVEQRLREQHLAQEQRHLHLAGSRVVSPGDSQQQPLIVNGVHNMVQVNGA
ncbi:unnamed protein product, partial [Amoebophrya sp. A25]|eukprot:GSA25T00025417001.1